MFGGLIASGPQIFHLVHKNQWLPRFGNSVLCGQAVNNWKFHQPLYPNQTVNSQITIKEITNGRKKNTASITWFYEFLDENSKPIQTLEMIILHNME